MKQRFEHTSANYKGHLEYMETKGWELCATHNEKDCEGNDSVRYWMKRPVAELSGEEEKKVNVKCPMCDNEEHFEVLQEDKNIFCMKCELCFKCPEYFNK